MPRILSPAYFHHYNAQAVQTSPDSRNSRTVLVKGEEVSEASNITKSPETDGEQLVLGLGPVQTTVWRLSKLVPLEGVRKHLNMFNKRETGVGYASPVADRGVPLTVDEADAEPQSLEIQENSEGISLNLLPKKEDSGCAEANGSLNDAKNSTKVGNSSRWRRVPYLPSYVPFGQVSIHFCSSLYSMCSLIQSRKTPFHSICCLKFSWDFNS